MTIIINIKKRKSKCPYDVEETNKLEILRHKKKLELKLSKYGWLFFR